MLRRYGVWSFLLLLVCILVYLAMLPETIEVNVGLVDIGTIEHRISGDGKVRFISKAIVDMPVNGIYTPAVLFPGDTVTRNQVTGWYRPVMIDERTASELAQRELALEKTLQSARSRRDALLPQVAQLHVDERRLRRLLDNGAIAASAWEQASLLFQQQSKQLEAAEFTVEQLQHEKAAIHVLRSDSYRTGLAILTPISGVVLRRFIEQERLLVAGTVLYEIGTRDSLEVVVDVLSTEASLIRPGMRAWLDAGGQATIPALVLRVEPAAFTKMSALGIEEQRVNVVLSPLQRVHIGDGYRVVVHVVLWKEADVLRVPSNAIAIDGSDTTIVEVVDGRAIRRTVHLGRRSRDHARVLQGLSEGATVVINPTAKLRTGSRVRPVE